VSRVQLRRKAEHEARKRKDKLEPVETNGPSFLIKQLVPFPIGAVQDLGGKSQIYTLKLRVGL
jgi:hypothetical protein